MMTHWEQLAEMLGAWAEARPYLANIYDEQEMRLLLAMRGCTVTVEQAAGLLGLSPESAATLLQRAFSRHVVDRETQNGIVVYSPGAFGARVDHCAKYDPGWDEIPPGDRRAIDRRFLDEFIAKHQANVERKMQGLEAENALPNDTVMLLGEIEGMIEAAEHVVVQPCDCRRLGQYCERPVETCIWLDDGALEALERGYGRRLSKEEAIQVVRRADKAGLMHTADSEWRERGLHAICNCCACDCYPFRAAQALGSKGAWPRSRYVAAYDRERCNLCGACIRRCHFEAFYHNGVTVTVDGKEKSEVLYEPERCWGCGLCANTCPSGAIVMEPLAPRCRVSAAQDRA
ncbi:MAG: ATP-binding protein [Anaerolineae bacterium]|jgi:NAD-dependent dihydropyrimidine dehydrogenase PreA subunit